MKVGVEPSRATERFSLCCDLSIVCEGYSRAIPVRVPDMSTKGMFINTPEMLAQGTVLKLTFRLPRTNVEIKARAEVRYCLEGVGIGVEFIDLGDDQSQAIAAETRL